MGGKQIKLGGGSSLYSCKGTGSRQVGWYGKLLSQYHASNIHAKRTLAHSKIGLPAPLVLQTTASIPSTAAVRPVLG